MGADDDEDEGKKIVSAMQKFAQGMNENQREKEFFEAMKNEEAALTQAKDDTEATGVLTDFYVKPYQGLDEVEEADDPVLPLYYFDNEDGFWDSYIQNRLRKWEEHPMIVNRPFIKV